MNAQGFIYESRAIHTDGNICVDVKATMEGVTLGQIHGEHDTFACDLHLTPEHADAIAYALLDASSAIRIGGGA